MSPPASSDLGTAPDQLSPPYPWLWPKPGSLLPHGLNKAHQRYSFSVCASVDPWWRQERKGEREGEEKGQEGGLMIGTVCQVISSSSPFHRGARCGSEKDGDSPKVIQQVSEAVLSWNLSISTPLHIP